MSSESESEYSEDESGTISASSESSEEENTPVRTTRVVTFQTLSNQLPRPTQVVTAQQFQPVQSFQQVQAAPVYAQPVQAAPVQRPGSIVIRPASTQVLQQPIQPIQPTQAVQFAQPGVIRIPQPTQPTQPGVIRIPQPTQSIQPAIAQPTRPTVQIALPQETIAQLLHKLPGINLTPITFDPNQPVDIGAILVRDPQIESPTEYSAREQLTLRLIESELQLNNLTAVVVGYLMMDKLKSGCSYSADVEQILEQMNKVLTQP